MQVNHALSDLDVALIAEALQELPHKRVNELWARLVTTQGRANQEAMQELAAARAPKAADEAAEMV